MKKETMLEVAHLHVHTDSSLLDGVIKPKDLLLAAAKKGIPAVAFTDHGNCGSHLEAQIEGETIENCPKIIFGSEMYFVDDVDVRDKSQKRRHIILLAKNQQGYNNLVALNNTAWRDHFYYTPRIDFPILKKHREGLICTSACCKGIITNNMCTDDAKITKEMYQESKDRAKRFKKLFGDDFYLEIQLIDIDKEGKNLQTAINKKILKIAKALNIPFIITNDIHYMGKHDHILHQKVLQLSRDGFVFETEDLWLKTRKALNKARKKYFPEMSATDFDRAIENTHEIANKCDHKIKVGDQHIPVFDFTSHPEYKGEKDKKEFFTNLVFKAHKRYRRSGKVPKKSVYEDRIGKELHAIFAMDAVDYFLIVEDLCNHLRRKNKLVMIRGSANGSLICYLLGFGHIDPIKHNILFERFISPARVKSGLFDVDIDIDMESEERTEAVAYLKEKYGEEKICNVGSYGRLMWRACIKDMARVEAMELKKELETANSTERRVLESKLEQFSFTEMNKITRLLEPGSKQEGGDISVEESIEKYPDLAKWWSKNEEWIEKFVEPIVGIRKSASIHPASVLILPSHIDEWLPVRSQADPKNKSERILCSQWECSHTGREDLRAYGTMALDILGVKTLSIIAKTFRDVEKNHGVKWDMSTLPMDDKKTIEGFKKGETLEVFQLSAPTITQIVKDIKPDCFADVVNLMAIDRPGALANKAHITYAKRKSGSESIKYYHKSVKPVLADTLGIPLFSEHIMLISMAFAGFKPVEAEKLRQLMKSKDRKIFAQYEEKFIEGAKVIHGDEVEEKAKKLWKVILKFGAYAFPKAHATSYGLISWATMFLKTNYPAEFFANVLNYSNHDEYAQIRAVAKREYGVKFIMPEINKSTGVFVARRGKIIWALAGIKGVGGKALEEIIEKQPYSSFEDFFSRVNKRTVNKARILSLIVAGAFRNFGSPLELMKFMFERRREVARGKKKLEENVDPKFYNYDKEDWEKDKTEALGFQTRSFIKMYKDKLNDLPINLDSLIRISEFDKRLEGEHVLMFGQAKNVRVFDSKVGRIMSGQIFDIDGHTDFVVWKDKYEMIKGKEVVRNGGLILIGGMRKRNRDDYNVSIGKEGIIKVVSR